MSDMKSLRCGITRSRTRWGDSISRFIIKRGCSHSLPLFNIHPPSEIEGKAYIVVDKPLHNEHKALPIFKGEEPTDWLIGNLKRRHYTLFGPPTIT